MLPAAAVPALAVLCGAVIGARIPLSIPTSLRWWLIPLLALSLVCWWRQMGRPFVATVTLGFGLAAATLAADAERRTTDSPLRDQLDAAFGHFRFDSRASGPTTTPFPVRFVILEDAAPNDDTVSMRASAVAIEIEGAWHPLPDEGVRLSVDGEAAASQMGEWRAGRTIEAPVTFRRPASYFNDGVGNFERDLARSGVTLFASAKSALLVRVTATGSAIDEAAARARALVRRTVSTYVSVHSTVGAAIVTAVLIGDRTGLPDADRERLQAAGTYHVIAISGGNIALLAGLILLLGRIAFLPGRAAAALSIVVLLLYAQIVSAGPSVSRATMMAVLYLGARVFDLQMPAWQGMSVAAMLLVLASPLDIFDPGFLLTFGATAALLEGTPRAHAMLAPLIGSPTGGRPGRGRRLVRRSAAARAAAWVLASICASLVVEIVLLPVTAQSFSRVTAAGVVLNLLAVPMMAVAQVAGMVLVLVSAFDGLAGPAGWLAGAAAAAIVESARLVDLVPSLAPRVPPPGLTLVLVYYAAVGLALRPGVSRWLGVTVGAVAGAAMVGGVPVRDTRSDLLARTELRLTVLDVGQAESMLVEVPGAAPFLIDAAGAPFGGTGDQVGTRVVTPALWAHGTRELEALLITHADPDHAGGAAAVVRDFAPRRFWTGVPVPAHELSGDLRARALRGGATPETLHRGGTRRWGRARLRVLHPPPPDWERPRVRNDDSVVLELTFGKVAILFTGDIGSDVEREILPLLTPAPIRILKVAHHGSRTSTSTALIETWRPHIALISAGRGNSFNHPTTEVLARLAGTRVYRTDRHGQITLETDGYSVRVRTRLEDHDD